MTWEKIETDGVCYTDNGGAFTPLATLEDKEAGRKAQIVDSRSHYTLWFQNEEGKYGRSDMWFIEAVNVLDGITAKRRVGRPFVEDEIKEPNDEDLCRS